MGAVERSVVLDGLAGCHHHSSSDGVDGVGGETGSDGDEPSDGEVGEEVVLDVGGQEGLDGVVDTEVESSVDDDTDAGDHEPSVESDDSVGGEGLLVDVEESGELFGSALLGVLQVVGESGSGVVQRVDEEERAGSSESSGGEVAEEPGEISVSVLVLVEHSLEVVLEGEVQGLGGEVSEHVGEVSFPEGSDSLLSDDSVSAVHDAGVSLGEGSVLEHLVLVLESELDDLDG